MISTSFKFNSNSETHLLMNPTSTSQFFMRQVEEQEPQAEQLQEIDLNSESSSSCYICRNRKVRCGRQLPECHWCLENGVTCIYPETSHKRHNTKKKPKETSPSKDEHNYSQPPNLPQKDKYKQNVIKYRVKAKPNNSRLIKYLDPVKNFPLIHRIIPSIPFDSFEWTNFIQPVISASDHIDLMYYKKGQFESNITKILASQLITHKPELLRDIEPYIKGLNKGNFDGLDKEYLSMSSNWFNLLFDKTFKPRMIRHYFESFHPMVTYVVKAQFYEAFQLVPDILIAAVVYVGYQYSPDQDVGIYKYTEQMVLLQLHKNFYNTNIHVAQALFIYSYALFYRGEAPKSLRYFYQACRMAVELGIQKRIPGLSGLNEQMRRTIASMMLYHDRHLAVTLNIEPFFKSEFNNAKYYELDYTYQLYPKVFDDSTEDHQLAIAEAKSICLMRKLYDLYWAPALFEFAQIRTQVQVYNLTKNQIKDKLNLLEQKLDSYLISSYQEFLNLDKDYHSPRCREVLREYVSIFTLLYHKIIISLSSHRSWSNPKGPLPAHIIRAHISAQAILKISQQKVRHFECLYYHYLSVIGLFYLHLLVKLGPNHPWNLPEQLEQIYRIFKSCPTSYFKKTFEVIRVICEKFQIQFNF